jgi:nucleotide-binding universal stress UspA family protein
VFTSIVVGTDFSPTAEEAVSQAIALAKTFGAKLHIVTAFKPAMAANIAASSLEAMAAGGAEFIAEAQSAMADEVEATHNALVKRIQKEGISCKTHGMAEDAADAIMEVAEREKCDLIVVGNRGMSSAKRFLLGNVPNKISHHSPCSVLIVRTT